MKLTNTPHAGDDWEVLFFRIFLERIEPLLAKRADPSAARPQPTAT